MHDTALITGGAGFIGSSFVHLLVDTRPDARVVVLDALTYAGNLENLAPVAERIRFVKGDIAVPAEARAAFEACEGGTAVVHFAAQTHVDRSIESGLPFLRTNVKGTQVLIDLAREFEVDRFLHVSTDEVYGPIADGSSDEHSRLNPGNPYSASKAASDHLVLAAVSTHGFPGLLTRCSNNYGPFQFPEKLVPLIIANARAGEPLPIYGDGLQERDWLYVLDHCEALLAVLEGGRIGEIYNIAARDHRTNLDVVRFVLDTLGRPHSLIRHVSDRPGHDRRYAPDPSKLEGELGWRPRHDFETSMRATIRWYQEHDDWLERVRSGAYRQYYERQYRERFES